MQVGPCLAAAEALGLVPTRRRPGDLAAAAAAGLAAVGLRSGKVILVAGVRLVPQRTTPAVRFRLEVVVLLEEGLVLQQVTLVEDLVPRIQEGLGQLVGALHLVEVVRLGIITQTKRLVALVRPVVILLDRILAALGTHLAALGIRPLRQRLEPQLVEDLVPVILGSITTIVRLEQLGGSRLKGLVQEVDLVASKRKDLVALGVGPEPRLPNTSKPLIRATATMKVLYQ
mmetsp:Transcript_11334/g.24429  ORF Transcript_11334/g.24429 Transcript_11334/m.24429 type:complete len:229 (-) Transcript_11334:4618-5304(-)